MVRLNRWLCGIVILFSPPSEAAGRRGEASWFSLEACQVNPDPRCPTASGRPLRSLPPNYMAAWFGDFGSRWRVCGSKGCAVGQLWDRGPAKRLRRVADLSPALFQAACGDLKHGVCRVTVESLP